MYNEKVAEAVREANLAFWHVVAKHFPDVKSGDMELMDILAFDTAQKTAVEKWLEQNKPN